MLPFRRILGFYDSQAFLVQPFNLYVNHVTLNDLGMALDRNMINVFRLGFDNVWDYVPNLTLRQTLLMIITGIVSLQGIFRKLIRHRLHNRTVTLLKVTSADVTS